MSNRECTGAHAVRIGIKDGDTYIVFPVWDEVNFRHKGKICNLLDLIESKYYYIGYVDDGNYYLVVYGEDKERAALIQKFIDNDYKLMWK